MVAHRQVYIGCGQQPQERDLELVTTAEVYGQEGNKAGLPYEGGGHSRVQCLYDKELMKVQLFLLDDMALA